MFGSKRAKAKAKARRDHTSVGRILLDLGYCDPKDLDAALADQAERMPRLGEMLIHRDVITSEQLEHALLRQRVLRGQSDPSELKRYGATARKQALSELTVRLRAVADSAAGLAAKVR